MESITTAIKPQQITSVRVRDLLAKAKEHMLKWNIEQGNEMPDGNKHKQPYKCTNINTGQIFGADDLNPDNRFKCPNYAPRFKSRLSRFDNTHIKMK